MWLFFQVDMKPYITQRKLNFGAGATFHLGLYLSKLFELVSGNYKKQSPEVVSQFIASSFF